MKYGTDWLGAAKHWFKYEGTAIDRPVAERQMWFCLLMWSAGEDA